MALTRISMIFGVNTVSGQAVCLQEDAPLAQPVDRLTEGSAFGHFGALPVGIVRMSVDVNGAQIGHGFLGL